METRDHIRSLYGKLPEDLKQSDEVKALVVAAHRGRMTVVHLIYRKAVHERASKDHEFSRASMNDHWAAGEKDAERTINHVDWIKAGSSREPFTVIDTGRPMGAAARAVQSRTKQEQSS